MVTFTERPGDNPEALKAWFYPGDNFGQQFVYPRPRALELAAAEKEPVLALPADTTDLRTATIVAITPEQNEEPVAEAVQTTPPVAADTTPAPAAATPAVETAELPKTASTVPLIGLLGLMSLGLALVVKRIA